MNLSEILIGVVTAALLIFLRSSHIVAQRQKVVSTQLESYLRYWKRIVLQNDWFNVFYIGVKWNKEEKELIQKGCSPENLVELENKKKEFIPDFKKKLEEDPKEMEKAISELTEKLQEISPPMYQTLISTVINSNQNIIEGKTFISDEDASHLDPFIASIAIDLKMKIVSMQTIAVMLLDMVSNNPTKFDVKAHSKEISDLLWQLILISKDIDTLSSAVHKYTKKSVFQLTIENIGF